LKDKKIRLQVKDWTGGANIRLALNCVGGEVTAQMASLLGQSAHMVSYGAMSKQPLTLSTSLFIFRNLTAHGYWQARWYSNCTPEERQAMMSEIVNMMITEKLRPPDYQLVTLKGDIEDITKEARQLMNELTGTTTESSLQQSKPDRKVLLSWS